MVRLIIYIGLLTLTGILANSKDGAEITIEQGILKGKIQQTWNGRTYNSFSAIPYAQPPIGNLRFKPPVPAGPWNGVFHATKVAPVCPQQQALINDYEVQGKEDCLYLNVYTPQLETAKDKLLPVMFFIHSGGFFCGSGNPNLYGPDILLDKDVVLVTINYRLGALGFLSTEDELLPGNWGLKDQNLALKWVKKNIANFGGNPDKITVFGQSAGGASTHFHVVSPLSKDLISGAIAQSGVALGAWALAPKGQALTNAKRLAEYVNCPNESNKEMIECLSKKDAKQIIAQEKKFMVYSYDPIIPFKPVIEPIHEGAFITEDPIDTIKSGNSAKVPFITGVTTEDGALKAAALYNDSSLIKELNKDFIRLAPIILLYESNPNKDEITKKIRHFYFGDKDINNMTRAKVIDLMTDGWFLFPTAATVRLHAKYTTYPVYYYVFGIEGGPNFSKIYGDPDNYYGVCHGDELFYLFSSELFPGYRPNESQRKCTDIIVGIWTAFARTGNPTPATESLVETKWEAVQSNDLSPYLFKSIDDIKTSKDMYKDRIQFWKNLVTDERCSKIKNEL